MARPIRSRRAQTLLELVAATTIIAGTLVPALRMMRDSLSVSRNIELASQMSSYCVSLLEQQMVLTSASWDESSGTWDQSTSTGDYSADGYPSLRYQVERSDAPGDGGISGALMVIRCQVWDDRNGNGGRDAGEPQVNYSTKIGNFASYADAANN